MTNKPPRGCLFTLLSRTPRGRPPPPPPGCEITKYYWNSFRKNWVSETLWGFPNGSSKSKHWFLQGVQSETLVRKLGFRQCFWVSRKPGNSVISHPARGHDLWYLETWPMLETLNLVKMFNFLSLQELTLNLWTVWSMRTGNKQMVSIPPCCWFQVPNNLKRTKTPTQKKNYDTPCKKPFMYLVLSTCYKKFCKKVYFLSTDLSQLFWQRQYFKSVNNELKIQTSKPS